MGVEYFPIWIPYQLQKAYDGSGETYYQINKSVNEDEYIVVLFSRSILSDDVRGDQISREWLSDKYVMPKVMSRTNNFE